ncbi:alpha/beta hydrolase [Nonomuraea sp. NPDC050790]|uniref:alpha/beta hydrolase n=1 Tax=Nonomuraea sp. NPDC050790 TaxID=3364371 RepID=UPI0037BC9242
MSLINRLLPRALVAAAVAVPISGAAGSSAVPAPVPAVQPPLSSADPAVLAGRYAAGRTSIRAARTTAAEAGHPSRAAALGVMASGERRFLFFDGRDGGRSAEVLGDLSRAGAIAVLVPGSDTDLDSYARFHGSATRLAHQLSQDTARPTTGEARGSAGVGGSGRASGMGGGAVVAWMGYRTPATASLAVLTTDLADAAAPDLRAFVRGLRAARPEARISLVCHSYGAVVCGSAAPGLPVDAIVLYGSPGTGADTAAALRTTAAVWAGRGARDWIASVPHARVPLPFATLGLGADPMSPGFGARIFPAGRAAHGDYLNTGSPSLRAISAIVAGA